MLPALLPLHVGPNEVLERKDKCFQLAVGGREETVSIDCLKPHLGAGPFTAALPGARGRPPGLRVSAAASSGSCDYGGYCRGVYFMFKFSGSKSAKLVVQKIREIVTRSALVYCLSLMCEYK